jgi:hypothetical protein
LVCPWAMLVYPRGGCAYLLSHWSTSLKQIWSQHLVARVPSWFLSATWCGEAVCRLGVCSVEVLLLLGGFFCQVWLQHLSMIFDLWSSRCLLPLCSCHLGSFFNSHCRNKITLLTILLVLAYYEWDYVLVIT